MKKYITTTLLAFMALCMTSCQKDITAGEDLSTLHHSPATVHVTANAYGGGTRTVNSGYSVTFEAGDQIGVYVLGKNLLENNVCFTYNGTAWVPSKTIEYCDEYIYYAYYPYVADAYAPDFSQETVDDMFAEYITDAGDKFHQADQSTKAAFNASDLMIGEGIPDGSGTVAFTLDHKKGLAVFSGAYSAVTFSDDNIPYTIGTKGYYLMKSKVATNFTDDTGSYILYASAGKYTTHKIIGEYLTFIALEDGTFSFSKAGLSYSLDEGETWTALAATQPSPTVTAGSTILWKNNTTLTPTSDDGIGTFSSTGAFDAEGNIMSLFYGDDAKGKVDLTGKNHAFHRLFYESKVTNAKNLKLPATTLADYCYTCMFNRCRSLITPPELPATTLTINCYGAMFSECSNLTTAPELPATNLATSCYSILFEFCTSLTTAPTLPATTLAVRCYTGMFRYCRALTTAPELPATTLTEECYQSMFEGCTSLTTAPELPAITLVEGCYNYMFQECSSLNYVKVAFTTTPSETYTCLWLFGVAATGTFYKNAAAAWMVAGNHGIPYNWTIRTYTP